MTFDPHGLAEQIHKLGEMERKIFAHMLHRKSTVKDANAIFEGQMRMGERVADRVATFGGSWTFIFLFLGLMVVWMAYNIVGRKIFDPYPFILLNLALSCVAALQAPVIMMSQNRQSAKDRLDARLD
jgi:uncharacterized membrane protein